MIIDGKIVNPKTLLSKTNKNVNGKRTKIIDNCQLEIDENRGVLYVHSPDGITLVRICQIPKRIIKTDLIDVVFDRELGKLQRVNKKEK